MKLIYHVKDKPKFCQLLLFAFQQLLAILAATIAVPAIINSNAGLPAGEGMSQSAALLGAGMGTLVYLLFTKFKSPAFLGSSFAFIGSLLAAFAGATSSAAGHAGIIIGAAMAGLVYVVIAIIVKLVGVAWISKLMPPVVIGPTVAIIGLSLSQNAIANVFMEANPLSQYEMNEVRWAGVICALITLLTIVICSVFGKKMAKLIPFIIGILVGYIAATIFTLCGTKLIDFSVFKGMEIFSVPDVTFVTAFKGFKEIDLKYILALAVAYVPVAFVVFAEHIADHKNLSSIIEAELLEEPGLHRTLLGDGVGSVVGSVFGGCPNTTYGESVGCVAITGNASVYTILTTAIMAIIISFFGPFVTFLSSIPMCVMGGVCVTLYGFIAVSGLKMLQKVDLGENKNLFVAAVILICGIGNMKMVIGDITITSIACALILGIIVNLVVNIKGKKTK